MVTITGVCDDVTVYNAIFIGILSSLIYLFSCSILDRYKIDDPIEAS